MPDDCEYDRQFYERKPEARSVRGALARALHEALHPASVIDVGCGRGDYLLWWAEHEPEVRILGLEWSESLEHARAAAAPAVRGRICATDIRSPVWEQEVSGAWDLCLCIEVAEHVDARYADGLVAGLCSLAPVVFFTAAKPGQRGVHHVNCRRKEYWVSKFERRGFRRDEPTIDAWKKRVRELGARRPTHMVRRNAMLFRQEDDSWPVESVDATRSADSAKDAPAGAK